MFSFDFFADGFLAVLFFGTEALCFVVDFFSFLAGLGLAAGYFFTGDTLAAELFWCTAAPRILLLGS